jgi:putative ABC transport system permease protein
VTAHRRWRYLEEAQADAHYALRQLGRSPILAVVCVLTLALGIGANTAIFSAVYAVLLRPLPFKNADRLALVTEYNPGNVAKTGSPFLRYRERAERSTAFEETGGYWNVSGGNGLVFGGGGAAERLQFSIVTNSFFTILGVQPRIGRTFSQSEEAPGGAKVFLASDALWRRLLGGSPQAIGTPFRLDGDLYTLIGILPPDFDFPGACDIWMPIGVLGTNPLHDRISHQFWMIGRLRPAVGAAQAQAELDGIQRQLAEAFPTTDANWHVNVKPLLDEFVANARTSLWVLFAAAGFVLLIACTNIANLLLARAIARRREFAVRAALGAARGRLLRQAFTETLVLVCAGTALALVLANLGLRTIVALSAGSIARFDQTHLSVEVFAFSATMALIVTLLVAAAPGLYASAIALSESLQDGQRGGVSRRSTSLRNALVVSEVALALLLLCGAGLMIRSFIQLRRVDPGFDPRQLTSMKIALPDARYPGSDQRAAFLQQLLQRLNATPGIEMAASTDRLPLSGEGNWGTINIVGRPLLDTAHAPSVEGRSISANYFRALGIPLLRGRELTERDVAEATRVTIINQTMANALWPGSDPIGQRVFGSAGARADPSSAREVIGVVGDVKDVALDADSPPEMYVPFHWWNVMNVVMRSTMAPAALAAAARSHVAALDQEVPVYGIARLDELVNHSVARQRFELSLLALFASIALILAAVGIYGLLSFAVSRRTHEMGLRMALGAHPRSVLAQVMSDGMKLVLLGLGLGLLASLALMRLVRGLLYQLSPADPVTFAAGAVILVVVGAFACSIPARRAMRLDPMVALRRE